jgi:hypothetical protein
MAASFAGRFSFWQRLETRNWQLHALSSQIA